MGCSRSRAHELIVDNRKELLHYEVDPARAVADRQEVYQNVAQVGANQAEVVD